MLGIFINLNICATAYADDNIQDKIEEEINKGIEDLILEDFEKYFKEINKNNNNIISEDLTALIKGIIKGDKNIDFNDVIKLILNAFALSLKDILPQMVIIVILSVLFSILKNLTAGFSKESTSKIVYFVVYGLIVTTLISLITGAIVLSKNTIISINKFIDIIFPVLLTLVAALGGVTTVAIYQPLAVVFTTFIIKIILNVVFPMFLATIVFTIIGNLTTNVKLENITKTIKSASEWILGIMFGLFITYITAQGIVGASIDNVSISSIKFALSSYVPILGGYLSDGFDVVLASCIVIKNAVGLISIIILVMTILIPIIKIAILSLLLKLCSGILQPIDDNTNKLLYGTSKNLNILISAMIGLAFMLFIVIMLIICSFSGL